MEARVITPPEPVAVAKERASLFGLGDRFTLTPINQRRWANFKSNRRGYLSFLILLVMFVLSLFAEFIANDRPIIARYKGETLFPVLFDYPESKFGGFLAITDYKGPVILDGSTPTAGALGTDPLLLRPHQQGSPHRQGSGAPMPRISRAPAWPSTLRLRGAPDQLARARRSATPTGSASTTRGATWWRASSTASAFRSCSVCC